jgi:peptide-methionine (S)-S-oxide reductase
MMLTVLPLIDEPDFTALSWVRGVLSLAVILSATVIGVGSGAATAAEKVRVIPPPAQDEPAQQATPEVAVLAGGCFWGVQGVYQHVKGVEKALSGYAGGSPRTAHYEIVGWGNTGHAESVQVMFDPQQITYGKILQIFFSVVHDPTQLNRQGPDTGTQYRSAVFPASAEQAAVAKSYIAQLNEARVFDAAIVTKIEMDRQFYPAENYHQDYLKLHPTSPYIIYNDLPKIASLKRVFPELYRAAPVLVNGTK